MSYCNAKRNQIQKIICHVEDDKTNYCEPDGNISWHRLLRRTLVRHSYWRRKLAHAVFLPNIDKTVEECDATGVS